MAYNGVVVWGSGGIGARVVGARRWQTSATGRGVDWTRIYLHIFNILSKVLVMACDLRCRIACE
eukprot:1391476-Amorphochlora_amoeboformis.AAC.1